jgi:hypothetical protein
MLAPSRAQSSTRAPPGPAGTPARAHPGAVPPRLRAAQPATTWNVASVGSAA